MVPSIAHIHREWGGLALATSSSATSSAWKIVSLPLGLAFIRPARDPFGLAASAKEFHLEGRGGRNAESAEKTLNSFSLQERKSKPKVFATGEQCEGFHWVNMQYASVLSSLLYRSETLWVHGELWQARVAGYLIEERGGDANANEHRRGLACVLAKRYRSWKTDRELLQLQLVSPWTETDTSHSKVSSN